MQTFTLLLKGNAKVKSTSLKKKRVALFTLPHFYKGLSLKTLFTEYSVHRIYMYMYTLGWHIHVHVHCKDSCSIIASRRSVRPDLARQDILPQHVWICRTSCVVFFLIFSSFFFFLKVLIFLKLQYSILWKELWQLPTKLWILCTSIEHSTFYDLKEEKKNTEKDVSVILHVVMYM